jgi:transposase-like protein
VLDVSSFKHCRINHSELFTDQKNHINGIENFWNQAKRHMPNSHVLGESEEDFQRVDSGH